VASTAQGQPQQQIQVPGGGASAIQQPTGSVTQSYSESANQDSIPIRGDELVERLEDISKQQGSPDAAEDSESASGTNQGAIDNRIEQAMDLVKSHLMNAVRSEVEELKEKIIKLEETINQQQIELTTSASNFNRAVGKLQAENQFLRNHVGSDVINQLSNLEFYDPVNQATQQQQQNQVQNIQDSQSIQVSTTKQTAPSTQSQQSHQ
jgi:polyhydroxyalkanoate synthesis regulator phasin